jgi:hypothetical protein
MREFFGFQTRHVGRAAVARPTAGLIAPGRIKREGAVKVTAPSQPDAVSSLLSDQPFSFFLASG